MPRLSSIDELEELRYTLRERATDGRPRIVVCAGTACQASGSNDIIRALKRYVIENRLQEKIALRVTGCHGFCEMGPFVVTEPQKIFYAQVTIKDVPRIIDAVLSGDCIEDLLYRDPVTGTTYHNRDEIPFFKHQRRTILALNQKIDPMRINDYIAEGGYGALGKVLAKGDPEWVIEEVKTSGLRGRGGAGFPTGLKWELLAKQSSAAGKYLVCNADEGDPGAYMDRSVLEGNPHSIIEGVVIGAYGTGATEGVVYVRNEYPVAIKHLTIALGQAREYGLLGNDILGSGFSFDIEIVKGAGAFVCGEETALIKSVEGKMGEPRQRPPFPITQGINGKPTAINNVETWANIPIVFSLGAEDYAKIGTKGNTGTKIFSLVGKIRNTGLVEVPMGITIREIVYDIGGGCPGKARVKAVQTGGPSGGCIPAEKFDLPIDYDTLAEAGSIMGSGGMIVMDENTCMVDVAKYFMNFLKDESCGKCLTCRKGTQRMYELLDDICSGRGTLEHLELLEELAHVVKDTTMCGLGQTAANPVLSTLRYFRHEYERHILDKRCDAFVCKELVGAPCQCGCPLGTEVWRYVAHLQRGEYEEAYRVIREPNPFPSVCGRACHHPCEDRCRSGLSGSQPVAIRALKRFIVDNVPPGTYKPVPIRKAGKDAKKVAVVGSGPAGLTAAHYLSLLGHKVTVYEAEAEPGGMLIIGIPAYRLPRDVVRREIDSIIDENVTLKTNTALGRDITIDSLFDEGFQAVFVATGAHKDRRLGIDGEDVTGIYPSMEFLRRFNCNGESLAKGRAGVIGGGNAAVDAARTAIRQEGVESVNIIYRRTREEMPAFEEEIDAAIEEGVLLRTLVSPLRIHIEESGKRLPLDEEIDAAVQEGVSIEALTSPVKIYSEGGRLIGIQCIKNELGEMDASGRPRPVAVPGTEHIIPLDTLIVAIGEQPDAECFADAGAVMTRWGTLEVDPETMATSRPGVFAGGDVASGPSTIVDSIAAGKRAAEMIDRYLNGEEMKASVVPKLPRVHVEPVESGAQEPFESKRAHPPLLSVESRRSSFAEVEMPLSAEDAVREAGRCLRCDLAFTQPASDDAELSATGREQS